MAVEGGLRDDDLVPIVRLGRERPDLDYKGPADWSTCGNDYKTQLVRDMMAMANAGVPGYIVIGATDNGGAVSTYDGLTPDQITSFDPSKIADKLKRYADPEVRFEVYRPTVDGRTFVVIRVLPFEGVPHICCRSYASILEEAAIYTRGEGARTIKVPSASYMRTIVDRAIQVHADALVDRIRRLVMATKGDAATQQRTFRSQADEIRSRLGPSDG